MFGMYSGLALQMDVHTPDSPNGLVVLCITLTPVGAQWLNRLMPGIAKQQGGRDAAYSKVLERYPCPFGLIITMDEDLDRRLKRDVPLKGNSAFISLAVRSRIYSGRRALDEAYRAASEEAWRRVVGGDWQHMDTDGWPE